MIQIYRILKTIWIEIQMFVMIIVTSLTSPNTFTFVKKFYTVEDKKTWKKNNEISIVILHEFKNVVEYTRI